MENSKQIYDRYLDAADGDALKAAHSLSQRAGVFHDNRDEYQEALSSLIREALCDRNARYTHNRNVAATRPA